jgi:gluconolactonase
VNETVDVTAQAEAAPAATAAIVASAAPAETPEPARSWAEKLCGPGPFPSPLAGTVSATPLPNSEPTVLDPKDTASHLYEGAVWYQDVLYFSDFTTGPGFPSRVMKYENGTLGVVIPDSGSNGLGLDPSGERLVAARHSSKSVSVLNASGEFEPVASQYQGKPFDSPNDLVFRSDGNLYFTDPSFQAGDQPAQTSTNVYRVAPDGTVTAVDTTMRNPNGISLAPDERTLYVSGNLEQGYVKSYPLAPDGSVGEGKIFLPHVTVPDGMVVDCAGNLYVTEHTKKRVRVITPTGKEIGQITGMNVNVTNVAFGGPDHKTLFITGTGRLFQIGLPVAGMPY